MTALNSAGITPASSEGAQRTNVQHSHQETTPSNTNPQQAPLRRAHYVKVIDLATLNELDVAKIREQTKKRKEELELAICASATTAETSSSNNDVEKEESLMGVLPSSATEQKHARYQKRIIPSTGGFNLCLLVGSVKIVVEKTRVDKSRVKLAECEVGDETGTVSLRARDDQIDLLEEISNRSGAVVLRNCSLELYQGKYIRLAISKWGKLSSFPDGISSTPTPPLKMNTDMNLSIVDLNDVVGEKWPDQHQNASGRSSLSVVSGGAGMPQRDAGPSAHSKDKQQRIPSQHYNQSHTANVYARGQRNQYSRATYNPNIMHMTPSIVPGMNSFSQPIYPSASFSHYGFAHTTPVQNAYQHQQQQYDQQKQQEEWRRFQEYTYRMQFEAMRLYQQQDQTASHLYGQTSQGLQVPLPVHNPNPSRAPRVSSHDAQSVASLTATAANRSSESPMTAPITMTPAASITPEQVQVTPTTISPSGGAASFRAENDAWSIRQEAESPMMNPHAAVFTSAYNMPSLSLPPQHYYAPSSSFSFAPYSTGLSQAQPPAPRPGGEGDAQYDHLAGNPISQNRQDSQKKNDKGTAS